MRVQLTAEMLKEMAGQLDSGMKCFYHLPTGQLEYYPDEMRNPGFDEELWEETMKKVEENFGEYIVFKSMESYESFEMMENFIDEIPDRKIQERFRSVIQRRKPFQQFKYLLFDYPELRQQWFTYKENRYIEYIKEQADMYNEMSNENEMNNE